MNGADTLLFNDSVRIKQCRGGPVALGEIRSATPAPVIHCHRASVIEERRHRFNVTTPAERKARRKRFIENGLIVALFAAVAVCGVFSLPLQPGAVPVHLTAPGVNADNAPVRWRKSDFPAKPVKAKSNTSSPVRVAPASTTARRGYGKTPAPGSVSKRKGAAK